MSAEPTVEEMIEENEAHVRKMVKKWTPLLDHKDMPAIKDPFKRGAVAVCLENLSEDLKGPQPYDKSNHPLKMIFEDAPANNIGAGNIATFDPVMMAMARRMMPNLVHYDFCGVQPMTGPTGIAFAKRTRYINQTGNENFYNEVDTWFSSVTSGNSTPGQANSMVGGNSTVVVSGNSSTYNYATGMSTAQAEALGTSGNTAWAELAFSIEKIPVVAVSRKLRAQYTMEAAQDIRTIHGMDMQTELSNDLAAEILAEQNRELIRTVILTAVTGSQAYQATPGVFDLDSDSNGRWSVEKWKGVHAHIEFECNAIAKDTRKGKGNVLLCSSNVASALQMTGALSYTPALDSNNLQVDDTGITFAGVLNGRVKVFIDPYAGGDFIVVGYKGAAPWESGLIYCPYVPLQMVRAVNPDSYNPSIGLATRYGIVANPFAEGLTQGLGAIHQNSNKFYRRSLITHLM